MKLIYGTNNLAKEIRIQKNTLFTIMREYPDFPRQKLDGVDINVFDLVDVKAWFKQYHPEAYENELKSGEMMLLNDFTQTLGVTRTMVNHWIKSGFECKKLLNSNVLIEVEKARKWFLNQKHLKTIAYAEKLPMKGSE